MNGFVKLIAAAFVCLFAGISMYGQHTAIYWEVYRTYKTGLELYDVQDYVNARKNFEETIEKAGHATDEEVLAIQANAAYYRAVSALKLLNPDGIMLMKNFIDEHAGSARLNMAKYFLGDYYFKKKKYKEAIEFLESTDTRELSYQQELDYSFQLAYAYFFRKKFDKARPLFAKVKNTEQYAIPANYYHGFISFDQDDLETALTDFQKVESSPYFGKVVPFYIVSIYFRQKDYGNVIAYGNELLENHALKYYPEINQLIGKAYFNKKDYNKALPLLLYYAESTRRMAKEDLFQLGYTHYQLQDYDDAIEYFGQLTREKDSIGQNAMYLMGDAYIKTGELKKASTALKQASTMNYDPFVKENALFNYGKLSYELGNNTEAILAAKSFIKDYPNSKYNAQAKEFLTEMFLVTRNFSEAIEIIESISLKTPKLKQAYQKVTFYKGVEYFNDKDYGNAGKLFDKSLTYPIDASIQAQTYYWKAEIKMMRKLYESAARDYSKYITLSDISTKFPYNASLGTAQYGLGYAYFKMEKYQNAGLYFGKAVSSIKKWPKTGDALKIKDKIYPDAVLRWADCLFMTKDYEAALSKYEEVTKNKYPGTDYAYFQKGMLYGVRDNLSGKEKAMKTLTRNYPNSFYYDDGLYQLASTYMLQKKNTQAIQYFDKIINENQNSPYVLQSLMKAGLIHYNKSQDRKAIPYYKKAAINFKGTPESREALAQLKLISIELGDPDIYLSMKGTKMSEADSVKYEIAYNDYERAEFSKALNGFNIYLTEFPEGFFAVQAHYYRGDCLYRDKKYKESLPDYEYVIQQGNNKAFLEVSYLRAAKINDFILKDYNKAFDYYQLLYPIATSQINKLETLEGLVETGWLTGNTEAVKKYAQLLINNEKASEEDIVDAHYYLGKIALKADEFETAMNEFTKTKELTDNEKGVESRYQIANIHFKRNELGLAEAACDDLLKNHPSYQYWNVSTLILISDIYVEQEEYFQAKGTLESIVNSYQGDAELLKKAQDKLDHVLQLMENNSRIKQPDGGLIEDEGGNDE
jgi:TolA-binding protein